MRGKYSPTISLAYSMSQQWWDEYGGDNNDYDREGYDSYGYDKNDVDRAGIHEDDYMAPLEEYLEGLPRNDPRQNETTFEDLCAQAKPFEIALVERLKEAGIL